MAGFTLGQADMIRRAMGKKKLAEMLKWKDAFLYGKEAYTDDHGKFNSAIKGAINNGVSEEIANKIWNEMEAFASYAFNKSHAAAYSLLTYQTAYLKTYYLPEFLTATLNNRITNIEKLTHYIAYAKSEGIKVLPPDINLSDVYFNTDGKSIRFGLSALKNVGISVMEELIEERKSNGPFKDLCDFCSRVSTQALNKRCIESLIKAGAFDCFKMHRSVMMAIFPIIVDRIIERKKKTMDGQMNLFGELIEDEKLIEDNEIPKLNEYVNTVKLLYEKEISGTYLSGHPLDTFLDEIKHFTFNSSFLPKETMDDEDMTDTNSFGGLLEDEEQTEENLYNGLKNGDMVTCGGVISEFRSHQTKTGARIAFMQVEDLTGKFEVAVFSKAYDKFKDILADDALVAIKGRFSVREGKASIIAENIELLEKSDNSNDTKTEESKTEEVEVIKPKKLYLKYNLNDGIIHDAVNKILSSYNGIDEVIIKDTATNKAFKSNIMVTIRESLIFELETILDKSCIVVQ